MTFRTTFRTALILLLAGACTGITARDEVLLPAMSLGWSTTIAVQIEHDVSDRLGLGAIDAAQAQAILNESDAMQAALDSGDHTQVIGVNWGMLRLSALGGVQHRRDADEIGWGTAISIVETVDQFNARWVQLLAR
jgi:hypothetical protein